MILHPSLPAGLRRCAATLGSLALLAGAAAAQAAEVPRRWGPNPAASSYGDEYDSLFAVLTALTAGSFLIVLVLLLLPVLRDRARPGHKARFDHGRSLHDKRFTAISSIVIFFVLDASVLYITMKDLREGFWNIPAPDTPDVLKVQVLAQQWAWNFRTPGSDGEFGTADDIVTMNELTVPVDTPIQLNLTSKDVIHSLFIPDMRLKRDANPGAVNEAWFEPVRTGRYDILCAELCGFAHYQMHAKLTVLGEDDHAAWEAEASTLALAAYDVDDHEAQWAWAWQE